MGGWVVGGGWLVHLDYNVSSGPFFEFWISYWTWTRTRTWAWQFVHSSFRHYGCCSSTANKSCPAGARVVSPCSHSAFVLFSGCVAANDVVSLQCPLNLLGTPQLGQIDVMQHFSVPKATKESQMSIHSSVRKQPLRISKLTIVPSWLLTIMLLLL